MADEVHELTAPGVAGYHGCLRRYLAAGCLFAGLVTGFLRLDVLAIGG